MKKLITILLLSFLIGNFSYADTNPTQIGNITAGNQTGSSSYTMSYTAPSTGSNRMLLVFTSNNDGNAPTCTWNGTSMTEAAKGTVVAFAYLNAFYIANPDTGTHNVVCTIQGTDSVGVIAITLQDAVQTSPVDGTATNGSGSNVTTRGATVTTGTDNSLVLLLTQTDNGATSPVQGGGQTEIYTGTSWRGSEIFNLASIPQPTAGAITPSISWTTAKQVENVAFGIKYQSSEVILTPKLPDFIDIQ